MSLKNLAFYISVALETKSKYPNFPISDKTMVMMAIDMDYVLMYGMKKLEYDKALKVIGRMFR